MPKLDLEAEALDAVFHALDLAAGAMQNARVRLLSQLQEKKDGNVRLDGNKGVGGQQAESNPSTSPADGNNPGPGGAAGDGFPTLVDRAPVPGEPLA